MDLASGEIELSQRYIKKLNCGYTLQSHNDVVLQRNNSIETPSVKAAIIRIVLYDYFNLQLHKISVLRLSLLLLVDLL